MQQKSSSSSSSKSRNKNPPPRTSSRLMCEREAHPLPLLAPAAAAATTQRAVAQEEGRRRRTGRGSQEHLTPPLTPPLCSVERVALTIRVNFYLCSRQVYKRELLSLLSIRVNSYHNLQQYCEKLHLVVFTRKSSSSCSFKLLHLLR